MRVAVVIAAYDEEATIEALTRRLVAVLRGLSRAMSAGWEIIFVVDGRDGTRGILERVGGELGGIRVVHQEQPQGLGNAFKRGFAAVSADADVVVTMDADLNHQPEELPRLLKMLRQSRCDVVVGSRFLADSTVEGTPFWKRVLSGTLNLVMRYLYGLEVRDRTSGYRVYRAEVLRQVSFRRTGYAFLPELLIAASRRGLVIREEPIRFVFRREGRSKMGLVGTSISYLALLTPRLGWNGLIIVSFLVFGVLLRVANEFPVYKWTADADSLLTGMRAFSVLRGEAPVFFSGVRIGALEAYAAAPFFLLAGSSRATLALVPLLFGLITMLAIWGFCRELLSSDAFRWAIPFAAFPSVTFVLWTGVPDGYPAVALLCALMLWAGGALGRARGGPGLVLGLGTLIGLGFWHSLETVGASVPVLSWLAVRRRDLLRSGRSWQLGGTGFLLGAFPWLAYNIAHPLGSFQNNYGARPVSGVAGAISNLGYFFGYRVPEIVVQRTTTFFTPLAGTPAAHALDLLEPAVYAVYGMAVALLVAAPWLPGRLGRDLRLRLGAGSWLLLALLFGGFAAINVLSEAGQARAFSVRYALPLYFLVPPTLGVILASVRARSRALALLPAVVVLTFNLVSYHWPWSVSRHALREQAMADQRLITFLKTHRVEAVVGGYWTAYPLNFLTHEAIVAVPCSADYYLYRERVPRPLARWALVSARSEELTAWAPRAGLTGPLFEPAPQRAVILVDPSPARLDEGPRLDAALATCKALN